MAKKPANVTLPRLNQSEAAALVGRDRRWIRDNVPKPDNGEGHDPRQVVQIFAEMVTGSTELDEISRRKKLAEAERAERELRLADLKIARLEAKLMPVDWIHRMLEEMGAELRKPIEIIGRKHPEYQQMFLDGLDNAMDKVATILADDQPS